MKPEKMSVSLLHWPVTPPVLIAKIVSVIKKGAHPVNLMLQEQVRFAPNHQSVDPVVSEMISVPDQRKMAVLFVYQVQQELVRSVPNRLPVEPAVPETISAPVLSRMAVLSVKAQHQENLKPVWSLLMRPPVSVTDLMLLISPIHHKAILNLKLLAKLKEKM
jgi:hypothetical protein